MSLGNYHRLLARLTAPMFLAAFLCTNPAVTFADSPVQGTAAPNPASGILQFTASRIQGNDRIATAIATSQKGWSQANVVFLDEYDDYF